MSASKKRSALIEKLEARQLLSAVTQWSSRGPGGGGAFFSPSFSPFNSNELYTVTDMSSIYHSANLGQSWSASDFRQIQGGIGSQVQFTSDPNILYTLDYSNTAGGGSSTGVSKSTDAGKTWKQVPGWNGANNPAYGIFADPQNTTSLLVTDYGNLYFSNNGGQSFSQVYTEPNSGQGCYVGGVFWDGNNVYAGTPSGLIVSTDGGAHFSLSSAGGLPVGSSILSLAGAKQNGVTRLVCITASAGDIYNGLETTTVSPGSFSGIWTLTPGQASWTKSTSVPAHDGPLLVSMSLNDINTIYVGGTDYNASVPIVAKSTDGGKTFADALNVTNNGNVATGWQGAGGDRQWTFDQLALGFQVSPTNSNDIAFTGLGMVHLSTDGGATWQQAYVNPADQNPAGSATPQHKPYHGVGLEDTSALYLAWANQQTILAGYTDINGTRSTDGGQSWSFPTGINLAGNTVYCIAKQGNVLYAGTSNIHDLYQSTHVLDSRIDGGNGTVLFSIDNGASWQVMHSFGHPVIWVATDPTNANRMYASVINSSSGGIYVTNNLSAGVNATWTKVTNPPRTQGHPFNIDVLQDGTVVATFSGRRVGSSFTDSSGVFVSSDGGQTWSDRTGAGMHWWTKDITIDPTDPAQNTWYASVRFAYGTSGAFNTGGLYRTTNRGQSWTQIFQSIGAESAAVSPTTGEMYLSTEENGLYYSANPKAAVPVFTQTTYPFRQPERIFFNPYNPSEVWVTSFGYGLTVGNAGAIVNTSYIAGNVFSDANSNGIKDGADAGIAGATVYIDANKNGVLDAGESSTTTNASGNYAFVNLAAGTYRVAEILPSGDTLTAPAAGFFDVVLAAAQGVIGKDFADHPTTVTTGTIAGDVYVDANNNGIEDSGETYLSGIKVYIDANHNGLFDAGETYVTSTVAGTYTFSNLAAGSYRVREIVPAGYTLTQPAGGFYDVALAAGQNVDDDFGNHPTAGVGIIRGSIFNDLNSDAVQNNGEPSLQGWTAYIDKNLNGKLDPGEPTAVTDATGYFTFQGVAPGSYRIREVVQSGWTLTRPALGYYDVSLAAGQTINDRIFGNHHGAVVTTGSIAGTVFNDANINGKRDTNEAGLSGWLIYLDLNRNGKLDAGEKSAITNTSGQYLLSNITPGTYHLAEVLKTGWRKTTPGATYPDITVTAGTTAAGTTFGNTETAIIAGAVYRDLNGNGIQDAGETGLAGWRVYADTNHDGIFDNNELSTLTYASGAFYFLIAPGTYTLRVVQPAGYAPTVPSNGSLAVTVGSGAIVTGKLFGEKTIQ